MWPLKKKVQAPPVYSAGQLYFQSFKDGEQAVLMGRPVTIVRVDPPWYWDSENLMPEIVVAWWDGDILRKERLSPREVNSLLTKA